MSESIRLLPHTIDDGATNMAIDEAILIAHLRGKVGPTLRLYGWQPPAVSIGYGQKISQSAAARFRENGFDVVRRPTGGRAVLHSGELTYSFVASSQMLSDSVIASYKQICRGLILAIEQLGVKLDLGASTKGYKDLEDCFMATTNADLHVDGRKMIGSAQLRRGDFVLQHGSILLSQPQDLLPSILRASDDDNGSSKEADRHANLFEVLGRTVSNDELQASLQDGFSRAFEVPIAVGHLTEGELDLAKDKRDRYIVSSMEASTSS